MAEKVNIASLTIEVDDVIKESTRLKKQMESIKKAQKDLDKTTEEGALAYEALDAKLKNTTKAYRDNQKFAAALDQTNQDLNKTMQVQGKSTQELYDSRRQLNQIAKNIQGNTEEEIELREKLNETIDEQTQALREQQSTFNSGKDQIGEYTQGINAADFNLKSFVQNSQEAGGAGKFMSSGLKGAISNMKKLTTASLRFLATPVGLVLGVIAGLFALVRNAMNRSEESTNKLKVAFSGFTGILKSVLKFLQPVGDFLINGIVKGVELAEKALGKFFDFVQRALERLGFEKAAAGLEEFREKAEEAAEAGRELTKAELAYTKAQREARKVQLLYQKDAEKLRQIRDDETKSFKERIAANEELGKVLNQQLQDELSLAQKALDLANLRIKLEGETTEALDARADAETEIIDIQERITGQTSEQLTNRVSLQREATEAIKAANEEEAKAAEEAAQRKIEAARKAAEASIEWANFELAQYIRASKSKIDEEKFLTSEVVAEEERRLQELADKQAAFETERFSKGLSKEAEYREAIAVIEQQFQESITALRLKASEAEQQRIAIDTQNRIEILEGTYENEFVLLTQKLERERQLEIDEAEKTGASIELINKKYAQAQKEIDQDLYNARLSGYEKLFGNISELLGENTKASKAAGIAQATINTYQGISEVWKSPSILPEPLNTISKVAASGITLAAGLKTVSKIRSTDESYSLGGLLKGRSHARGGIPFSVGGRLGYEAEGDESIINKKSTAMFRPLLSEINAIGGGVRFANGGFLGSASSSPSSLLIDYDALALRIAEANSNLPNPVVSVEEINRVNSDVSTVEALASS